MSKCISKDFWLYPLLLCNPCDNDVSFWIRWSVNTFWSEPGFLSCSLTEENWEEKKRQCSDLSCFPQMRSVYVRVFGKHEVSCFLFFLRPAFKAKFVWGGALLLVRSHIHHQAPKLGNTNGQLCHDLSLDC